MRWLILLLPVLIQAAPLSIDTGTIRVELVDPADAQTTGWRFLRGGWVRSLRPSGSERGILREHSLHPRLPAFGFPFEFYPRLKLDQTNELHPGVGIVREKGEGRFETVPLELFPWTASREAGTFVFRQNSGNHNGYAYSLTVRVSAHRNTLKFELELINTGTRLIETELYAHPFFESVPGYQGYHQLTGELSAGDFSDLCKKIVISTTPETDRAEFWQHPAQNCFSLEPFWKVSLPPGKQQTWQCLLTLFLPQGVRVDTRLPRAR